MTTGFRAKLLPIDSIYGTDAAVVLVDRNVCFFELLAKRSHEWTRIHTNEDADRESAKKQRFLRNEMPAVLFSPVTINFSGGAGLRIEFCHILLCTSVDRGRASDSGFGM